jgi:tRNA threonylcarbamoyladenosine biosynthesis protein TsaB
MPGPLSLVLETSTPHASLCTVDSSGHLEERAFTSDRNHNAILFSPLQELLDARGEAQVERVLAGTGPGSYSGTRVGIAAAQGVAIAFGCPAIGVPSILAVPSADHGASCLAIGDARRGSYWTAEIQDFSLISQPELTDARGLQEILCKAMERQDPVFAFEQTDRFPIPQEIARQVKLEFPTAARLWKAWSESSRSQQECWAGQIPQPIYLKPPHITPAKRSWLVQPGSASAMPPPDRDQ